MLLGIEFSNKMIHLSVKGSLYHENCISLHKLKTVLLSKKLIYFNIKCTRNALLYGHPLLYECSHFISSGFYVSTKYLLTFVLKIVCVQCAKIKSCLPNSTLFFYVKHI